MWRTAPRGILSRRIGDVQNADSRFHRVKTVISKRRSHNPYVTGSLVVYAGAHLAPHLTPHLDPHLVPHLDYAGPIQSLFRQFKDEIFWQTPIPAIAFFCFGMERSFGIADSGE